MSEEKSKITFNDLLDAGLHFGHQTKRWNPKMKRYIFGKRNGIHIIDLAKTLDKFAEARDFITDTIMRGRKVLLVGTKKQAKDIIQKTAEENGQPYVVNRWLGGMLTNAKTVRKSINRMEDLEKMQEEGPELQRSKREMAKLGRELDKLHSNLNGIRDMDRLPGALIVIDINRESNAVKEARCLHIPVVATIDTNCDPDLVDYPIPANDDSIRSVELIIGELGKTIKSANENYERVAAARKLEREKAEAEEKAAAEAASKARKKRDDAEKEARRKAVEKAKQKVLAKAASEKEEKPVKGKEEKAAGSKEEKPGKGKKEESAESKEKKPAESKDEKPAESKKAEKSSAEDDANAEEQVAKPVADETKEKVESSASEKKSEEKPSEKEEDKSEVKEEK